MPTWNQGARAEPDRKDWSLARRAEELRRWTEIIEAPDYAARIWRRLMPDLGDRLLRQSLHEKPTREAMFEKERLLRAAHEALERERALRAQAESERDALLSSTSWRMTAPLRLVIDRIRRPRLID